MKPRLLLACLLGATGTCAGACIPEIASEWVRIVEYPEHHLNDFCLFRDLAGAWHAVGILGTGTWKSEQSLFHSTGASLSERFENLPPLFTHLPAWVGSRRSWNRAPQKHAPHVIVHEGTYHLFYRRPPGTILVVRSTDPRTWPDEAELVFEDRDARDVCVVRDGPAFLLYYCQAADLGGIMRSSILLRRSVDLRSWSEPVVVHFDTTGKTAHSKLESPFVVRRPEGYYLFLRYRFAGDRELTTVYLSTRPNRFPSGRRAYFTAIEGAHAAEIVEHDGEYWIARTSGAASPRDTRRDGRSLRLCPRQTGRAGRAGRHSPGRVGQRVGRHGGAPPRGVLLRRTRYRGAARGARRVRCSAARGSGAQRQLRTARPRDEAGVPRSGGGNGAAPLPVGNSHRRSRSAVKPGAKDMRHNVLRIVRAGCAACIGLIVTVNTGHGKDENNAPGPRLAPKPYQIGIAPSHITKPTAPLFGSRADDWDEVRKGIDFYKFYSLQAVPPDWASPLPVDSFAAFVKKHRIAIHAEFGNFRFTGGTGEGAAAAKRAQSMHAWLGHRGLKLHALHLDGPIRRLMGFGRKEGHGLTLKQAAEEIAIFLSECRRAFPGTRIGLITNLPNWHYSPEHSGMLGTWTDRSGVHYRDAVEAVYGTARTRGTRFDFVEVDCPLNYYRATANRADPSRRVNNTAKFKALQQWCEKRNLEFWLLVNFDTNPQHVAGKPKLGSRLFHDETLTYIGRLRKDGIFPDCFTIQSWYKLPAEHLPEEGGYSFMHTARDSINLIRRLFPEPEGG